ncbi:hypothetical protein [Stenotrophomonas sp. ZAC14D2_NAIMI4_7]|uniref:hypothetical protein n=1 Tax=Stenotrophomonas sp. ZAC14D2_NAIMI4_7 TaxID=2072405 RepID=UPI00131F14EA|nr:hypothetical protein [Stenotrophomonas sp. ZAC14D2_NAIMI4_7]
MMGRKSKVVIGVVVLGAAASLYGYYAATGSAPQAEERSATAGEALKFEEQREESPRPGTGTSPSKDWAHLSSSAAESRFLELRGRAEAGDVIAQRQLAELFERCSVFSLSPSNMYSMLDAFARVRGASPTAYDGIKKRFSTVCSGVDGGQVIPKDAYMTWLDKAARQGDPYAKVALASKNYSKLQASDYQSLARDVVNSSDPEAVFALGDLLALAPQDSDLAEYRPAVTGPYANYAWGIAACRMGADCGSDSYRMDSLCVNTGICNSGDYESAIRTNAVPAGQQESLDKAIAEVQRVVGKKPI